MHARFELPVEYTQVSYNATVGIKIGIENQRLWRLFVSSFWVRNALGNCLKHVIRTNPFLGARQNHLLCRDGKNVLELTFYLGDIRVRQVNLVNDWDDREIVVHRQVNVRHRLGLYSLCGINHQQCTLTGAETAGNFVRKIYVPRSVDQVQFITLTVLGIVIHRDRMGLDGDAAFLLEVHRVEKLVLHFAIGNGACLMK